MKVRGRHGAVRTDFGVRLVGVASGLALARLMDLIDRDHAEQSAMVEAFTLEMAEYIVALMER